MKFEKEKCIIKFLEDVTIHSISELVDKVDDAIHYYQYDNVEIQINTKGGHVDALEYFLSKLEKWKNEEGIKVSTLVLSSSASAGAIMFAMGNIGMRRVMPNAHLLFHNSRTIIQSEVTALNAEHLNKMLKRTDKNLFKKFFNHNQARLRQIYKETQGNIDVSIEAQKIVGKFDGYNTEQEFIDDMKKKYKKLFKDNYFLSANDAVTLGLADQIA